MMAPKEPVVTPGATHRVLMHAVMVASGAAGLGYQIAWTRMFSAGLGHEVPGILAVVSAFFAGLALGAFTLDRAVGRAKRPGRWYVGLELAIGVWALVTVALIPALNELAYTLIGAEASPARHWLVAFILPALTLLPATTAMGATLPAMDRIAAATDPTPRRHVGGLYASNTLGAVLGTCVSAFVLLPVFGYTVTTLAFASVNVLVAAVAFALYRGAVAPERSEDLERERRLPGARLAVTLFATGGLGIGYEVLAVRTMGQVLENTVYSFAAGLSAFLVGTAIGGALYQKLLAHRRNALLVHYLLVLLSSSVLLGVLVLSEATSVYGDFRATFGATKAGSIGAEFALGLLVFGAPTVAMGMLFSHLAQTSRRERSGVGFALGINTIGSSLGPVLFGVVLLPLIGAKLSLVAIAGGYLLLLPGLRVSMLPSLTLPAVLGFIAVTVGFTHSGPVTGETVVWHSEGVLGTVTVVENGIGERFLKVNNKFSMGGYQKAPDGRFTTFAEPRQAHIPLLLHGSAEDALFLGVGTGATLGAVREWPGVRATGVELVPEIVEATRFFEPVIGEWRTNDRIDIVPADARRFVRADDHLYDVIVADLFHPSRDGAGTLYTREHFEAIEQRLADGGLFCQWLPLYQLDTETVRLITRTFLEVFPDAVAVLSPFNIQTPMLGLIGSDAPLARRFGWTREVVTDVPLAATLIELKMREDLDFFGGYLASIGMLDAFAGDGPINTDDHPIVVYEAPSFTYSDDRTSYGTLLELLEAFSEKDPKAFLAIDGGDIAAQANAIRLRHYWDARDLTIRAMAVSVEGEQVRGVEMLIEALELSRDYAPARQMLRQIAPTIMRGNPSLGARIRDVLERRREPNPLPAQIVPGVNQ